jgi:hypothetical protein
MYLGSISISFRQHFWILIECLKKDSALRANAAELRKHRKKQGERIGRFFAYWVTFFFG